MYFFNKIWYIIDIIHIKKFLKYMSFIDDIKHKVEDLVGGKADEMAAVVADKASDMVDAAADAVKAVTPDAVDAMVDKVADSATAMATDTVEKVADAATAMVEENLN